jgi:hypothetical protein
VDPAGLHHRPVALGDGAALASFSCTSADSRVETWIRTRALDSHLDATAGDDFQLLLFHEDAGAPVAVAAHERNHVVVGPDGDPVAGTYLILIAITDRFRGGTSPDGRRLIDVVLDAVFGDIRTRNRGPWVAMMVQPGNVDGEALIERLGARRVGASAGDEVFVLAIE